MNVYAITEKRVRIQRERLIVQAQEFAAANGESPLQPMDSLSLLAQQRTSQAKQPRGGENFYQQNQNQDLVFPRLTTFGNTNMTITPSRITAAHITHPRDLMSKLGDRDITMVPAHTNGSLSIMPIKKDSFPFKNSAQNGKVKRDITMIPLSKQEDSTEEQATDLSMPTDLSVRKRSLPQDLSKLNIPSATTIVPVLSTASNQPVDLSCKSVRPKKQEEPEYKYTGTFKYEKFPIAKKYKVDKPKKQEYESEAEMDEDGDYEIDMEPGTEAGMDGDMAMEQAYEPETESEVDSRPGATPDSLSSHSVHADRRRDGYDSEADTLPLMFQPNGNEIALVNSFFLNQLWQPEFIDTELLKEFHRKREELKEKKRKQRQMSRARAVSDAAEDQEDGGMKDPEKAKVNEDKEKDGVETAKSEENQMAVEDEEEKTDVPENEEVDSGKGEEKTEEEEDEQSREPSDEVIDTPKVLSGDD